MADQQLNIKLNAIDNTKKAFNDLQNNLKQTNRESNNLTASFLSIKGAILGFATGATITGVVNQTRKFQDLQTILSRVTGSAENGTQVLNFLIDSTKRSTFTVQDLANSFITLSTAGITPTERLLKVFTDTASASTDQLDTLNDLTRLFAKGVQGGLGLQGLNQLVAKGIPAFKILETELGLSKDGIEKFAQTSRGANKILEALINGLEKSFAGATEERAKNLSVALSRISKESDLVLQKIGDQGLTKSINDLAESFSSLTTEGDALLEFLGKLTSATVDTGTGFIKFAKDVANALKFTIKQEIDDVNKAFDLLLGRTKNAKVGITGTFTSPTEITGRSTGLPTKEEEPKPLLDFQLVLQRVIEDNQNKLDKINDSFTTTAGLTKTITDTLNAGIGDFSQKLAESIVLGKSLADTFKNIGQNLLIAILKNSIEIIARKTLELALEKMITKEKIAQASISSAGGTGGGGFFGSLLKIGFNAFAGGGSVPLDAPNFYNPVMEAEGGAVRGGMPITVGERGRELFVPSTSGTIVPNHDLAGTGSNITFNIQSNDVRGIKELLIDNRATIINLVNQGANKKGKSNVV
jgi:hypothetical protein